MDKNTVTGLVLIGLLLFGYTMFMNRTNEETVPVQSEQVIKKQEENQSIQQEIKNLTIATDSSAIFSASLTGDATYVTLENEKVIVKIGTKGGVVSEVKLKEYKGYKDYREGNENPLTLFSEENAAMSFALAMKDFTLNTRNYYFVPENVTDSTVSMRLADDRGASIVFDYELLPNNYMVNFSISSVGLEQHLSPHTDVLSMDWQDRISQHEKGSYFENQYSTLTYRLNDDDTEMLSEFEAEEENVSEVIKWIAFKNQYFSNVMISVQGFQNSKLKSIPESENADNGYLKHYSAKTETYFDPTGKTPTQFQFYYGPNQYRLLQSMEDYKLTSGDLDLHELFYLGWPLFKWINRYFTIYVFDWLTQLGLPMGIVLLIITLILRVIVYIPTKKSFLSSARMRVLKPKVDEISAKYPKQEDALKRQQETMTLYSQYGVSPMGGCLPMLLQMPIWIAMFNFVPNAIELRQESFLWAEDLSTYDSLISWNYNIPFIGNHLSLFCLLFCASNILYTYMTMRQQRETMSAEQAQQMKLMQWMMYLMPVFFFFMFNKYSSGLNYYYFISLLFSALTMWYLRKTTDDKKLLAKLEENYRANKNNPKRKVGGLAARLEALQKQQEEMLKAKETAKKNKGL